MYMKKLLILLISLLPFIAKAQSGQSKITLKNGTEITGIVKSIDPAGDIVLSLAGNEVSFRMVDVAKIEEVISNNASVNETQQPQLKSDEKLIVTDKAPYPESFDLKIGNETVKMILVRGGDMNMGFAGRHSISMNSEPVHKVGVTSFYMSNTYVTSKIVSELTNKISNKQYYKTSWDKANYIVQGIAIKLKLSVRLPTEAEWEYAACSKEQDILFERCKDFEFCNDLYGDYQDVEYRVDPKGPEKQKYGIHVVRSYSQNKGKFCRKGSDSSNYFRLVIKAKDIKQ